MSWSCEVCGQGQEANHILCGISDEIEELNINLKRLIELLEERKEIK